MKLQPPNYTQIPNILLDNLDQFTCSETLVLLCLCRQTLGWHRKRFTASASFLAKGTGMTERGVYNGVQKLLEKELLTRTPAPGGIFTYEIDFEIIEGEGRNAVPGGRNAVPGGRNAVPTNKERVERKEERHSLSTALPLQCEPEAQNPEASPVPKALPAPPEPDAIEAAEAIYRLYPRKVGKPAALNMIKRKIKAGVPVETLEKATAAFALVWRGATQEELVYCPNPATWFYQDRYNDDPSTWRRKRTVPQNKTNSFHWIPGSSNL